MAFPSLPLYPLSEHAFIDNCITWNDLFRHTFYDYIPFLPLSWHHSLTVPANYPFIYSSGSSFTPSHIIHFFFRG